MFENNDLPFRLLTLTVDTETLSFFLFLLFQIQTIVWNVILVHVEVRFQNFKFNEELLNQKRKIAPGK